MFRSAFVHPLLYVLSLVCGLCASQSFAAEAENRLPLISSAFVRTMLQIYPAQGPLFFNPPSDGPYRLDKAGALLLAERNELYLKDLGELDPDVAEAFCKQAKGGTIVLDGVTILTDATADKLEAFQGKLFLRGVTTVSLRAAQSLSKCKGQVVFEQIKELPAEVIATLKASGNISLPDSLKSVPATNATVPATSK